MASADTPSERFRCVAGRFTDRAAEVAPGSWENPAPCAGWTARDVVAHLVGWVPEVVGRSGLEFPPGPPVVADPLGAWVNLAGTLQRALDDPTVAGREFDAGPPGTMTVASAIDMLVLGDVLVHTWDLARAAGLDDRIDAELAAGLLAGMQPIDDVLRASGQYGPKVPVAPTAGIQAQLIAFTGRDPDWAPPDRA